MTSTSEPRAVGYSLLGLPLLETGMTTTPLAQAANLWVHGKVYSRGGENALHAHTVEDHTFFVVQGAARFSFADGAERLVRTFEGVLLPKGTAYRFEAEGGENLVMLRIGAAQIGADWSGDIVKGSPAEVRQASVLDAEGRPILDPEAKGRTPAEPVRPLAGRVFGAT
jgi:mannose-6-phosphate isomerase-like protein (cupin superfamily)